MFSAAVAAVATAVLGAAHIFGVGAAVAVPKDSKRMRALLTLRRTKGDERSLVCRAIVATVVVFASLRRLSSR